MMSDDALDEFVMTFKEKASLDIWRAQIESLVALHSHPSPNFSSSPPPAPSAGARSRGMVASPSNDSYNGSEYSAGSDSGRSNAHSSAFSGYTRTTNSTAPLSSIIHEEDPSDLRHYPSKDSHAAGARYAPSTSSSSYPQHVPSPLGPRDFTPLDLMIILSVPSSGPNSLKLGIIKSTLDFVIQNVGPRTRISVVTFSTGEGTRGVLRKTPFIAVGKTEGRKRLETVVSELGCEQGDCVAMIEHKEERVNVVTACNLALDIVLQRKVSFLSFF
jgi:hypothetical protein